MQLTSVIVKPSDLGQCKCTGRLKINMRKFTVFFASIDRAKHHYFLFVVTKRSVGRSMVLILRLVWAREVELRQVKCWSTDNWSRSITETSHDSSGRALMLWKAARNSSHVNGLLDRDWKLLALKFAFYSFVWMSEQTAIILAYKALTDCFYNRHLLCLKIQFLTPSKCNSD